ncbi:universal stress protein [Lysinimonas soli]|uniref:Universal stress protein n=1 Tax=Lysinimonas soli TaxID=1074233 RepID=A0ABW0NPA1_9MICO
MSIQTVTEPTQLDGSGTERILIASDGGAAGLAALRWAIAHAGARAVDIELVHVVSPRSSSEEQEAAREALHRAEAVLRLVLPAAEVTVATQSGDPAEVLARASAFNDVLVIGTHHGHRGSRLFRGLPQRLAAIAHCTVVVVPSEWIAAPGPVVLGVAADPVAGAALGFAQREAERTGRPLTLAHAWDLPGVGAVPADEDPEVESIPDRQRRALDRLDALVRRRAPGLQIGTELRVGAAVPTLLAAARNASLLVVGRPARSSVSRALLGSVGRGVLAAPPCPVAVIP